MLTAVPRRGGDFSLAAAPLVIEGALDAWTARRSFSLDWFRRRWGEREVALDNSIPGADRMRLADFLDAIEDGTAAGRYLDATPVEWLPGLADALGTLPWLPADRNVQRRLWLGPAGTVLPFHKDNQSPRDGNHNLFAQFVGRKRVRLVSPQFDACMYPAPPLPHDYQKSLLDLAHLERFPKFGDAEVHEAVVGPGDVLFIPAHWWHHVEALDASISVSFWWRSSRLIEIVRDFREALRRGTAAANLYLSRRAESVHVADVEELGGLDALLELWSPLSARARDACDALLDEEVRVLLSGALQRR